MRNVEEVYMGLRFLSFLFLSRRALAIYKLFKTFYAVVPANDLLKARRPMVSSETQTNTDSLECAEKERAQSASSAITTTEPNHHSPSAKCHLDTATTNDTIAVVDLKLLVLCS